MRSEFFVTSPTSIVYIFSHCFFILFYFLCVHNDEMNLV